MGTTGDGDAGDHTDPSDERRRYRELLEELRTIIPGVQVLFAFLLTAPFASRFPELDRLGRVLYGLALIGTATATVLFLSPASHHRLSPGHDRSARVRIAIRLLVVGMAALAVSILAAVLAVTRFVFGPVPAAAAVIGLGLLVLLLWYVTPLLGRGSGR